MIKNLFSKLIIFSFCLFVSNNSYAATDVKGAATQLIVTMTKVEICESGSTISNCLNPTDITVNGGGTADIASVAAGASAATVADFSLAPLGKSYTHIQTTMSRAFTITGKAGTGGKCTTIAGTNGALNADAAGRARARRGDVTCFPHPMAPLGLSSRGIQSRDYADTAGTSWLPAATGARGCVLYVL